ALEVTFHRGVEPIRLEVVPIIPPGRQEREGVVRVAPDPAVVRVGLPACADGDPGAAAGFVDLESAGRRRAFGTVRHAAAHGLPPASPEPRAVAPLPA